jgi:aspartate-semialdehyde dehydrogenase
MSLVSKSSGSHTDPRAANLFRIAIVGAASLMGKEVAQVLRDRNFPSANIRLLDDDEALGQLEAVGDEINFIQGVRAEQFENIDFTFFASDPGSARSSFPGARAAGNTIIDLSGALEDEAGVAIRAPWIERETGKVVPPQLQPEPVVVAHPAAIAIALLALRASKGGKVRSMVATILEPVSEYGQKGMDELHEQTINLLSFQTLPKKIFDVQVAFNMVARYGAESKLSLEKLGQRIAKDYHALAAGGIEPALFTVQAPVFHGYAFSIYLEMEERVTVGNISAALAGEHVVISDPTETPNNVIAASQDDVLLTVRGDGAHENGFWLWAVIDNLRVAALNAVECAETLTASRPRGPIQ